MCRHETFDTSRCVCLLGPLTVAQPAVPEGASTQKNFSVGRSQYVRPGRGQNSIRTSTGGGWVRVVLVRLVVLCLTQHQSRTNPFFHKVFADKYVVDLIYKSFRSKQTVCDLRVRMNHLKESVDYE